MSIFVDLDSLFDTRLVTLSKMDGVDLDRILSRGYRNRIYDRHGGVDYDTYVALYAKRDMSYLTAAVSTGMMPIINKLVNLENEDIAMDPALINTQPQILVNTHPYILSSEEDSILLGLIKSAVTSIEIDIGLCSYAPSELTPIKLTDLSVTEYISYSGMEWVMSCWERDQCKSTCPHITLIVPQIITVPLEDPSAEIKGPRLAERFKNQEDLFSPLVLIEHLPVTLFSALSAPDIIPMD